MDAVASLPAYQASNPASTIQPPATPFVAAPTATANFNAAPTAVPLPAPKVDRVGFPENYETAFKQFFVFDRIDAKSIPVVCANTVAASVKPGQPYPYGSVFVFETWRPVEDAQGNVVKDANGHLIRSSLNTIFVMRKEQGFGVDYQTRRSGEWEYVAFRPDKTYQTPPDRTASCASCHLAGAGQQQDFVFRTELFFTPTRYGQSDPVMPGEVGISRMSYQPGAFTVKAGTAVTWRNSTIDNTPHTVTANDKSFDSGVLMAGKTFSTRSPQRTRTPTPARSTRNRCVAPSGSPNDQGWLLFQPPRISPYG